ARWWAADLAAFETALFEAASRPTATGYVHGRRPTGSRLSPEVVVGSFECRAAELYERVLRGEVPSASPNAASHAASHYVLRRDGQAVQVTRVAATVAAVLRACAAPLTVPQV